MKKYLSVALSVFVLTATANTAQAFNKNHLAQLKKTNQCNTKLPLSAPSKTMCNLSYAQLSWANLYKADLSGANLGGANLSKADLSGASLYMANLYRANLTGANLTKANLREANLKSAKLIGANLTGATWTDGRKCGKGSIGKCVRDNRSTADKKAKPHDIRGKWKPSMGMRHPSRPCMEFNRCGVDRRSAAEKRKNPYDIRGK